MVVDLKFKFVVTEQSHKTYNCAFKQV